ncbi:MAG: DNA-formamidopyrimidine glycosylase [Patescibacteria group bacterium]|nr:DNA-formamidopyrimidine glycosylase [Patescibacteria group bacterium]
MPELPEVQTVVSDLRKSIRGWMVADFSSLWEKNVSAGMKIFKKEIFGAKISDVKRKGKYILIELDNSNVIVLHLRMTGALIFDDERCNYEKIGHVRHCWVLKKGERKKELLFSDVRKFATVDLLFGEQRKGPRGLRMLGVDPLGQKFTAEFLGDLVCSYPKRTIRSILLDQDKISGIGNIYVSEILFAAKISPLKETGKLNEKEVKMLCNSTKKVLKKAIELRGTTFSDYRDLRGERGSFQDRLKVYNREHGRCSRRECSGVVLKEKIQGRSAFWCPKCQK